MSDRDDLCLRCKKRYVEAIDDWVSIYCSSCADVLAEKAQEWLEWEYYHPKDDAHD